MNYYGIWLLSRIGLAEKIKIASLNRHKIPMPVANSVGQGVVRDRSINGTIVLEEIDANGIAS